MLIGVAVEEIEICLDYKPITISTHDSRREGIVIHETSLLIYMYENSPVCINQLRQLVSDIVWVTIGYGKGIIIRCHRNRLACHIYLTSVNIMSTTSQKCQKIRLGISV